MEDYKIYAHISPSGKYYIGQTKRNVSERWNNGKNYKSSVAFNAAINKYGWDNFEHKVLFTGLSKLEADMIEIDLIWYFKKQNRSYNLADGGEGSTGHIIPKETLEKMSERMRGKHLSPHTEFQKGHKWDQNTRDKMIKRRLKPVQQFTLDGQFVKEWPSASSVREAGMDPTCITRASTGVYKQAYGYLWRKAT